MRFAKTILLATGAGMAIAGCGGAPPDDYLPLADVTDRSAATTVKVVSPREGAVVGPTFTAEVEVDGELSAPDQVVAPVGLPHLHFRLDDGALDPDKARLDAVVERREDPAAYSPSVKTRLTYEDVPPGEHVLLVDLVRDDHDPATEIAGSSVTFSVKDDD